MKAISSGRLLKRAEEPEATGDPYSDARNAWMERYGSYIQQAYNWRLIAMLEAVALVVAVFGFIFLASQTKFVPYVVAIDKIGTAVAVSPADRASPVDPRVVRAELGLFIVNARSVVTDRIVALKMLDGVYAYIAPDSSALGYINDWYRGNGHSPLDRARKETVQVALNAILPISPSSYELQWTETLRDSHGKITSTQTWDAAASVAFTVPSSESVILKNPLGLYITTLSWTQKV